MKLEDFKIDLNSLKQGGKTVKDYKFVVQDYFSREERHYCAYLFSWLLQNPENIKAFLGSFDKPIIDKIESVNYKNVKLFYEFTWLRDIIYEFGRHTMFKGGKKEELKAVLNDFVFENKGDIQKKKPDLALLIKDTGTLILIEAKFEEQFDRVQIEETKRYGEALIKLLGKDIIKESFVTLIGREYYLDKHKNEVKEEFHYPCLSWESLYKEIKADSIRTELEFGLENQRRIHPRT